MTKDKSILIKNIYYMLVYAFTNLKQKDIKEIAGEKFDNLHNLLASILANGISNQLKQGLYREYINRIDNLTTLRGKIDMSGTIKNFVAGRKVLTCEYDELSENNLLNQILKMTSILLIRHGEVDSKHKAALKKVMLFFNNVDEINPSSIRWSSLLLNRNNQTYRLLLNICQFILKGMLLTTDDGEYKLMEFADDQEMCRLYEKFLLEYYRKEFPQVNASRSQITWALDDNISDMLPIMQTDIMLTQGNNVLIIDAKYYTHTTQNYHNTQKLRSDNLYQIFTYVKNKAAEFNPKPRKVSGMLLYARTDENIQPDNVYQMSGNQISVKTLDLNKDFSEIAAQLNNIVSDHFK